MRIAFLIMAHNSPPMLKALVAKLRHEDTAIYIHIDANTDESSFRAALAGHLVHFVNQPDRIAINYAGYSMVRATLSLLRLAYANKADRFVLLSGVDYPVQPLDTILSTISQNHEMLEVDRRLEPHREGRSESWFEKCAYAHYFGDNPWFGLRSRSPLLTKIADKIGSRLPRRKYALPIYYGSAWWSLTEPVVADILGKLRRQPKLFSWFGKSRSSSEMVFQTLAKAYKQTEISITLDQPANVKSSVPLHYVEFVPGENSPRDLTIVALPAIIASKALFCRKLTPSSGELMAALDAHAAQARLIPA